ncbi:phosphonate metabolism transcriptional regulator PhnF [Martelella sp. HB161492]|uniref:phosphonate metabolism transcriptional regulator PhnF n=1 Tax=Martelella sp. HB161492 TaxID=2720726 RepID=UPI0015905652
MAGVSTLARSNGVALWRQIADLIRQEIAAGSFDSTGMVPPEMELAARFAVNRHTVRAALAALAQEGVVRSERGRGTFIARQADFAFPISRRTRFSAGLGEQARVFSGSLLEAAREQAPGRVARALALDDGDEVIRTETVRRADGVALSRATSFFPADRFGEIGGVLAETLSVTAALKRFGVEDYLRRETEVTARHASPEDCAALNLSPGAILLVARSVNTDLAGRPIQYSVSRFAADRVRLTIDAADLD